MWEVREGDSRDLLRAMPDASVDAIVCDPPYELGFMGKAWDASGIAYSVPLWTEALRVLKPGGHLLAFGGSRTFHRLAVAIEDAGFHIRDSLVWMYGSGFPKSLNVAKGGAGEAWSGWGTALKPAQEPIVMARKPLAGTIVETVLRYGTGAIDVDGCRIPHAGEVDFARMALGGASYSATRLRRSGNPSIAMHKDSRDGHEQYEPSSLGRWPANVLLSHSEACGDGCAEGCPVAELGDFARFFYTAKPSARERDAGLGHLPTRAGVQTARANVHPTVKPIELMRHLVRLVTPPGGLVLDPFTGSGTTGCAAVLEGARFLGLELSPEYAEIARARIAHWAPTQAELWPAAE